MKQSPTYEDFKNMIFKAKEELQHKPVHEAQFVMNYNDLKYVYELVRDKDHIKRLGKIEIITTDYNEKYTLRLPNGRMIEIDYNEFFPLYDNQ